MKNLDFDIATGESKSIDIELGYRREPDGSVSMFDTKTGKEIKGFGIPKEDIDVIRKSITEQLNKIQST